LNLQADDRVLLLALPPATELLGIATALTEGLLVGLAPAEQVYAASKTVTDFENTMFAPADPEGIIPWRDHFFTVIFAPHLEVATDEIRRVLAPGGIAYLASSTYINPAE
jgi:SAM-dependent methyltransferase